MSEKATLKVNKKPKIIIVGGPTASGKSAFAIDIAEFFDGEIVGADSMQIYQGMDIGTGKLSKAEMRGVPHKMIDIIEPDQEYSVGEYIKDAKKEIEGTLSRGKLPIITGGTGLYVNALLNSYNFGDAQRNDLYRDELRQQADKYGTQYLHEELKRVDPSSAAKISQADTKRIIRALEIYKISGLPKSEKADAGESDFDYLFFALKTDRQKLYTRIEKRVDEMLEKGLIEEVKSLNLPRDCQSMKAIGYKETADFLDGNINLTKLGELIKTNTRHYAKRQITYFKNIFPTAIWIEPHDFNLAKTYIKDFLSNL